MIKKQSVLNTAQVILDTGYLFLAQAVTRLVNFLYLIYLAKALPIDQFGYLNLVLSIVTMAEVFADFGVSRLILRQAATDLVAARPYVNALLLFRLLSSTVAYVLVTAQFWLLFDDPIVFQLSAIVACSLLFTGIASVVEAILQSQNYFLYVALAHAALSLTQIGGGVAIIAADGGALGIAATFVVTNLVYASVLVIGVRRLGVSVRLRLDIERCRKALPDAAYYAVILGLFVLSSRLELLTLGWFRAGEELGLYGIAARIMDAALVAPLTFGTVLSPKFIHYHQHSPEKLGLVYARMFRIVLLLSVPAAVAAMLLAEPLMLFLLSTKYAGIGTVVAIMFAAYPLAAIYYLNLAILLGSVNQRRTLAIVSALVAAQAVCSLAAIPTYGVQGAATAFCISMVLASTVSTVFVRRWYAGNADLFNAAAPALVGAAIPAAIVLGNAAQTSWWMNGASLVGYIAVALLSMRWLTLKETHEGNVPQERTDASAPRPSAERSR